MGSLFILYFFLSFVLYRFPLQLATRVAFHEHLLPVCLPPPHIREMVPGTNCTVVGWGKREDSCKYSSSPLYHTEHSTIRLWSADFSIYEWNMMGGTILWFCRPPCLACMPGNRESSAFVYMLWCALIGFITICHYWSFCWHKVQKIQGFPSWKAINIISAAKQKHRFKMAHSL